MPHAKRMQSGAYLPEQPAHVGSTASTLQPAAPGLSPVCDTQSQHQQAAPSIQQKTSSAAAGAKALPVLPWMRVPISIEGGTGVPLHQVTGLHPLAFAALQAGMPWGACSPSHSRCASQCYKKCFQCSGQYTELFPVQAAAWRVLAGGLSKAHDLCIAAPTGSGKTLAYALPVLHCLIG